MPHSKKVNALVLSGGGARGAYQAGALKAVAEILADDPIEFDIYSGVSAGAINVTYLASKNGKFVDITRMLCSLWSGLTPSDIYRTNILTLLVVPLNFLFRLIVKRQTAPRDSGLLDPTPLRRLLENNVDFAAIEKRSNVTVSISALDYDTRQGVIFCGGRKDIPLWQRSHRYATIAQLTASHVMASAAIPIFFPAVRVQARYFGDGCLRNTAPLSPAIRLGGERLFIIGVRHFNPSKESLNDPGMRPTWGKIISTVLSAIFFDGLETDLERLDRLNSAVSEGKISEFSESERALSGAAPIRRVETFYLFPSKDIGKLAAQYHRNLPLSLRFLLRPLGASQDSGDLISYLLFERKFCSKLIDLGYQDAMNRKSEIYKFFRS